MDSTYDNEDRAAEPNSENQVVQPNSFDPQRLKNEVLTELLSDPKFAQSLKDKMIGAIKKDKGFKDYFQEIKSMRESGMTDSEIEMAGRIRELEELNSNQKSNTPGRSVVTDQPDAVKLTVQALGLDMNDPDISSALMSNQGLDEKIRSLHSVASKKQRPPNPAVVAQTSGDGPSSSNLMAEYLAKAENARGMALVELKMEYRRKGLKIS